MYNSGKNAKMHYLQFRYIIEYNKLIYFIVDVINILLNCSRMIVAQTGELCHF